MNTLYIKIAVLIFMLGISRIAFAQQAVENYMPFDPANVQSQVPVDFDSYYFAGGHRIYSAVFGFNYGIPNNRHVMGITVPVIHAIFNDDFAGFENTTGIGDLRFRYMGVPYVSTKNVNSLKKIAAYLEVTAPTGNERLGRGVGAWVYKPGIIFTYQPDMAWYIFPEIRFRFSATEVNSHSGSEGLPDLEDIGRDEKLQDLTISLPTTYELIEWNGWIGLRADYTHSYYEKTYFLFLRMETGKMIGPKTSASLHLTRFIAGQPRLQTIFQARLNFFLR